MEGLAGLMLCGLCQGAQNVTFAQLRDDGTIEREWHPCPVCGGTGARMMMGPPEIGPGWRRSQKLVSSNRESDKRLPRGSERYKDLPLS